MAEDDLDKERPGRWLRSLLYWHEGKDIHPLLAAFLTVCAGLGALVLIATALWLIGRFVGAVFTYTAPAEDDLAGLRNLALILAAVIGAPFIVWRSFVAHWQAKTAEQGLITSRITQAVQQLGVEKTVKVRRRYISYLDPATGARTGWNLVEHWGEDVALPDGATEVQKGDWTIEEETQPNLEVRLGAIYALERISKDSKEDHITVMEILCSYARENATAHSQLSPPRADIQAVLSVISRRSPSRRVYELEQSPPYRPDLSRIDLAHHDLGDITLSGVDFSSGRLEGANFGHAKLLGVAFDSAKLDNANFAFADLSNASFDFADMKGASLFCASVEQAMFTMTDLSCTQLTSSSIAAANFYGTNMDHAEIADISFRPHAFSPGSLVGAGLRSLDLSLHRDYLSDRCLDQAFGDASVFLPDATPRPNHWAIEVLSRGEFYEGWRHWRESHGMSWPPPGRTLDWLSQFEAIPPD